MRGKRSFPVASFTTHHQLKLPNSTLEARAWLSLAMWTETNCSATSLIWTSQEIEVVQTKKAVKYKGPGNQYEEGKKPTYLLQHPEGAILVIVHLWYFCRWDAPVGWSTFFPKELFLKRPGSYITSPWGTLFTHAKPQLSLFELSRLAAEIHKSNHQI